MRVEAFGAGMIFCKRNDEVLLHLTVFYLVHQGQDIIKSCTWPFNMFC